jgi:histone acetyltransferase (RNA polymerase elongator complex component)
MREIFDNADYRPDELKIYPMMVTDKSELTESLRGLLKIATVLRDRRNE